MIEQPTGVPRRPARPRRVTIALGPSTHDGQSLRALARLAREGAAELTGLFVEDDDLLRIASLPFAVEVCRATSVRRRVELAEVERQLRTQAAAAERALALAAEEAGVAWSFRVARGAMEAMLAAAAEDADLFLLAAMRGASWPGPLPAMPSRARHQLVVVTDRTPAGRRALEAALRLARAEGRPLVVLLDVAGAAAGARLREQVAHTVQGHPARYRVLERPSLEAIVSAAREENPAVVVLPSGKPTRSVKAVRGIKPELDCPVLLVR
ncbi:MAG: universal stress protein [Ectothiorhodospiraceae bacterium]|nr:universal stress protein [Chromatiales bacterium]MCP5157097.1 universal stress protein [Ectothiorhodospiraceae bacterium]